MTDEDRKDYEFKLTLTVTLEDMTDEHVADWLLTLESADIPLVLSDGLIYEGTVQRVLRADPLDA